MTQDWTAFTLNIGVKSTLETIYNAWTKSSEMEKWFLQSCKYATTEKDQNVISDKEYEWTWNLYDIVEKGKITQANGKDFFQFTFAGDCLVDIQLKEVDENILVSLKQHNIPTDEKSKFNIRIGCLEALLSEKIYGEKDKKKGRIAPIVVRLLFAQKNQQHEQKYHICRTAHHVPDTFSLLQ